MTNIAYDHQVFGFQQYGGVSRYFYELAKRVGASEGFSASIVAPLYVNRYLGEGGVAVKGFRIPVIPGTGRLIGLANRCIAPAMLRSVHPDVVHETYYRRTSSAPNGCPVVITVHDMIHEKFKSNFGTADRTSEAKRAAVKRADRIICVSESTRTDLIELFGPNPGKIKTIHSGVSLPKAVEPVVPPVLPRPYFLYLGQRGGHKNFRTLLTAYASSALARGDFDLIAFGVSGFTRLENEALRAAGLNSMQVRHLSGDDALLGHLYRNATAFVYPSLYEGFGFPPLEAMSCGCPVICSNTSSVPEVVGDAGLYFDPRSVEALREALELAVSSAELRARLVARGYERVKIFSYERCAAETLEVYRDALQ